MVAYIFERIKESFVIKNYLPKHCYYTDGFDMYLDIWSGLTLRGPVFVESVE